MTRPIVMRVRTVQPKMYGCIGDMYGAFIYLFDDQVITRRPAGLVQRRACPGLVVLPGECRTTGRSTSLLIYNPVYPVSHHNLIENFLGTEE